MLIATMIYQGSNSFKIVGSEGFVSANQGPVFSTLANQMPENPQIKNPQKRSKKNSESKKKEHLEIKIACVMKVKTRSR